MDFLRRELLRDAPKRVDAGRVPADWRTSFREATWDEALDLVASKISAIRERNGPDALAGFGSAKGSNEEAYLFQKLIRTGFGTHNVDHCTRLCHASSVAALLEGIGSGAVSNQVADVAQADWPQLQNAVKACQACGLCQTRRQTVFGMGAEPPANAEATGIDLMIVGEAPGENEDQQGLPFVGAAGQLLDQMLAALGWSRQGQGDLSAQVYITNVLKCRPPGNRNPQPDEVAQCLPFLRRQIEVLRPRLLLAMGRFGAQALLADTVPDVHGVPLGKLRGQTHRFGEIPLVVTYHPAYLLRNPADKAKAWFDLCWARSLVPGPKMDA